MITGIGAVTPVGLSFSDAWKSIKEGISGLSVCSRVFVDDIPWKIVGEIKDFESLSFLTHKEKRRIDPFVQYALYSALSAVEDSSVNLPTEVLVAIGSSRGGITELEKSWTAHLIEQKSLSPYLMSATTISMASSYIVQRLGIKGYTLSISNACASGTVAIGEAYRLIKDGYADIAIAGGTEAPLCRLCIEGYGRSGALSQIADSRASRPFDKFRDGFVISEGACILVLEELCYAKKRGARICSEISGYTSITESFHQTQPSQSGEVNALKLALQTSNTKPEEIDLINSHGTSTTIGDRVEASALKEVFGENLKDIPVIANKSMTGHMLAASGSFEVAITAMALYEGIIPPTINITTPDPVCNLNIKSKPLKRDLKTALTSSFGFGGINAVIVLKKYEDK